MVSNNRFQEALLLQNACNPSGVAHTLVEMIQEASRQGADTASICRDPAVRLTVAKLADLCNLTYTWPSMSQASCEAHAVGFAVVIE